MRSGTCPMRAKPTSPECGARILWARTRQGPWMPLDGPVPERGGPGVLSGRIAVVDGQVVVTTAAWRVEHAGEALYAHHASSCKAPESWNQHGCRGKDTTKKGP